MATNQPLAIDRLTTIDGGLSVIGRPETVLKQHQEVADLLMRFVLDQNLYRQFGDRKHIYVEAWQFCGHFYGISARERMTEAYVDDITGAAGFKSTADVIVISTGQVISTASALCLNNEDNWNTRPKYEGRGENRKQVGDVRVPSFQLHSMAQTRAISKALSNVLRFVVVLAGFSTTPAEEMTGDEHDQRDQGDRGFGREPERKSEQRNGAVRISEAQRKRLFAIRAEVNCPMDALTAILKRNNFAIAADVTRDKYDALVEEVRNWQAGK